MWQEQTFHERCASQEHKVGDAVLLYEGSKAETEAVIYEADKLLDGPYVYKIEVDGQKWPWHYYNDMLERK